MMDTEISVVNSSTSTTQEDLNVLFSRAGGVTSRQVIRDHKSGASHRFAFITLSAQCEADKAVSLFSAYILDDHHLRVTPVTSRKKREVGRI